jgi:drug/metabolite transporter (DMT)-like permease
MIAVIGGLGAALAWATTTICAARATRLIGAPSVLAWVMLTGLVITVPWAAVEGVPDLDGEVMALLLLGGLGNSIGLLLAYSGFKIGKVGVVAPIVSTEGAIAAVIAVAAGERLAPGTGVAVVVIAVGIVLAGMGRDPALAGPRPQDARAGLFGLAAAISFGARLVRDWSRKFGTPPSRGLSFRRASSASS